MKYLVQVIVTTTYEVTIEARSAQEAEEIAENMEYSEMQEMEDERVEFVVR